MIELIFTACLAVAPVKCQEVTQTFMVQRVTPQQCMFKGQLAMIQWLNKNPDWRIRKWTCRPYKARIEI